MTEAEKNEIILKTLTHEGGFGIDNNGGWVYLGINSVSNPNWPGWDRIEPLINHKRFEYFNVYNEGLYRKVWDDPILNKMAIDVAVNNYWNGNSFEAYNDKRIAANLFYQNYAGGLAKVLKCSFGTTDRIEAAEKANKGGVSLEKVIECRKLYFSSLKYQQQTPDGDPPGCSKPKSGCKCKTRQNSAGRYYVELGWNHYIKGHENSVDRYNADWRAGGSSTYYPSTGNNNYDYIINSNAVRQVSNPLSGNWFLEHLGAADAKKDPSKT
jgi:hypothetical protein